MSEENFNMSMRKFLKQVGVTSQQKLEATAVELSGRQTSMNVKIILTAEGTALEHIVEGVITLND